jgi:hypothetical protein
MTFLTNGSGVGFAECRREMAKLGNREDHACIR